MSSVSLSRSILLSSNTPPSPGVLVNEGGGVSPDTEEWVVCGVVVTPGGKEGKGEFGECGDGREVVWECSGGGCGVDGGSGGKDGG